MFYIAIEKKDGQVVELNNEKFRPQAKAEKRAQEWQEMMGREAWVSIIDTRTGAAI